MAGKEKNKEAINSVVQPIVSLLDWIEMQMNIEKRHGDEFREMEIEFKKRHINSNIHYQKYVTLEQVRKKIIEML